MSEAERHDLRIMVKVNSETGDRTYHPQVYDYPEHVMYVPSPYVRFALAWRSVSGCIDRYGTDHEGQYIEGVWTLGWAEEVIKKEKVLLGWYESHALNDDGTVTEL